MHIKCKESASQFNSIIQLPDYSSFKKVKYQTRKNSENLSNCDLCELCRKPGHVNFLQNSSGATETLKRKMC